MSLTSIEFDYQAQAIPAKITDFLRNIDSLVEQHRVNTATTFRGFVPSDYSSVFQCLKALYDSHLLCGTRFCEWGSGVSVVASLAAMVGYESYGIEFDSKLCTVAEAISRDNGISVKLVHGSFIPEGVQDLVDDAFEHYDGELALHTDPDQAYQELGHDVDEFDVVFAYPWPNDVELVESVFERCAATGAMLLVYSDGEPIRMLRKA